jgi:hypothetical protein
MEEKIKKLQARNEELWNSRCEYVHLLREETNKKCDAFEENFKLADLLEKKGQVINALQEDCSRLEDANMTLEFKEAEVSAYKVMLN